VTHVATICRVRLAVIHAVASLFGHNRLLSIFSSPSLAGSLADEHGIRCTEYTRWHVWPLTATAAFDVLADRFGIEVVDADTKELLGRYNVAPSQLVPIVIAPDGHRRLLPARWGLQPFWARQS